MNDYIENNIGQKTKFDNAKFLIDRGADINIQDDNGRTILHNFVYRYRTSIAYFEGLKLYVEFIDFLLENGIFIAPLISGSGVKIKVLEALSLGLPCVLTEIAAEGLDLPTTINISKTADDFTNDLLQLINNESDRKIRGLDAYSFIKAEFSDNKINSDLKECLSSISSK